MQWIEGVESGSSLRSSLAGLRDWRDEDWAEGSNLVRSVRAADRLDRLELSKSSVGLNRFRGVDAPLPDIFTRFVSGTDPSTFRGGDEGGVGFC